MQQQCLVDTLDDCRCKVASELSLLGIWGAPWLLTDPGKNEFETAQSSSSYNRPVEGTYVRTNMMGEILLCGTGRQAEGAMQRPFVSSVPAVLLG